MSDSTKQHSDLFQKVREAFELVYREHFEAADDALAALDSLEEQVQTLQLERDGAVHILECADTPLMRDVLAERDKLKEQLETQRETTQKWYDEAHAQRTAINRALHELDQWVFADGTASYRVERAEAILRTALASNPAKSLGADEAREDASPAQKAPPDTCDECAKYNVGPCPHVRESA